MSRLWSPGVGIPELAFRQQRMKAALNSDTYTGVRDLTLQYTVLQGFSGLNVVSNT